MTKNSIFVRLRRLLCEFRTARAGNVVITFALATLPIIGSVGFAVDYSHANSVKAAMQAALDSTALMLAKDAATLSNTALQTEALNYFNALFTRPEAQNVQISATYTATGGSTVVVNGQANVPTTFLGIIGYNNIPVNGSSTSKWGSTRLRVSLVLDNTGSMAQDGKITALKTATASLLTQLKNAASSDGDVYVSIVPFVKDVNLGAANWNSNWIYWDDSAQSDNNSWDANNGSCSKSGYSPRSSCVAQHVCSISGYTSQSSCTSAGNCSLSSYSTQSTCTGAGTCSISSRTTQSTCTTASCSISGYNSQGSCTGAGVCSISGHSSQSSCTAAAECSNTKWTTQSKCTSKGDTWSNGVWTAGVWTPAGTWTAGAWTPGVWSTAVWTPDAHSTWNGCVVDRGNSTAPSSSNYDTTVAAADPTIPASLYAAEQYGSCPQAVKNLSYDWTGMNTLVNNMSPAGNTNQAIGLQLGWLSLVGGGPFTVPTMDTSYQYQQVIILLTDGLNTQDRWYSSQSSIDARQALTCANIKAAGYTLYTIQVNTGGDPTSSLLQSCASDSTKFFLLTSASQILTTFNAIGTNLTKLRVAK